MQNLLYTLLVVLGLQLGFTSCSNVNGNNNQNESSSEIPALLDNPISTGTAAEWEELLTNYDKAVAALKVNPDDLDQYLILAQVYITEVRLTGNSEYYNAAALSMLDKVLTHKNLDKDNEFLALTMKSGVLLSLHQFADALTVAEKAYTISQHNAQLLGALVDAHVELGNYKEAVKYCDAMIQLRPDIRSYSRVSYLRQIHGDLPGAIEAMKMAVEAGLPGAESTEWARVILGDLLLQTGDVKNAEICFSTANGLRDNYAYALAGLGRLEKYKGNYDAAITYTENAIKLLSDVAFVEQLGNLYALKGNKEKATEIRNDILQLLMKAESAGQKNKPENLHNGSRELAMANLQCGNIQQAYAMAKIDVNTRPDNIDANELAAWTAYKAGDYNASFAYASKMLQTKTKNPYTLYKAAVIYLKAGKKTEADQYKQMALASNPAVAEEVKASIMH